jgi:hypothetical protein
LLLLAAAPPARAQGIEDPTPGQEQAINEAIERGNGYQKRLEECRKKEEEARRAGNGDLADAWRKAAEAWERAIAANRELIIVLVDRDYQIQAPPGTTIGYDPDSTDYAYTTGNKNAKTVMLCPDAFSDSADLVASTKLHELRHAWQIHWCWSSQPGYWGDCTFWDHLAEWDSYNEEEKAYDRGITKGMPQKEKDLIKRRLREHLRAMFRRLFGGWFFNLVHAHPGDFVSNSFVVVNLTSAPLTCQVFVKDDARWGITPPFIPPLNLMPEEERIIDVYTVVPLTAAPNSSNALTLMVQSGGTTATDVSYIVVQPTIQLIPIEIVQLSLRGTAVPLPFTIVNHSNQPASATIQFSNVLGWPQSPMRTDIRLGPQSFSSVVTTVTVPLNAPSWSLTTVYAEAYFTSAPTVLQDRASVLVRVQERDAGPLGITSPPVTPTSGPIRIGPVRTLPLNTRTSPTVWVMNTGYIDSFFDVFFEIELPNRGPGGGLSRAALTTDTVRVTDLPPGESREVQFRTLVLDTPGTYTMRISTSMAGDAEAANDVITGMFIVGGPTRTRHWTRYR